MTEELAPSPMGHIEALDIGSRKLTIQTEFFVRNGWRIETKIYLAGTLKKVFTEDLDAMSAEELQSTIDQFHAARCAEIVDGLRARTAAK